MGKGKVKGFFKRITQTQPGGSVLGNLVRTAGDIFTGGAISKAFPAPPVTASPQDAQAFAKERQKAVKDQALAGATELTGQALYANDGTRELINDSAKSFGMSWLKEKWYIVAGAVLSVVGIIVAVARSGGSRSRGRRR